MTTTDLIIGPQHPALHEPERFVLKLDGEYVVDVVPRIGYVHRGIEKAAELRSYIQDVYLIERICGICNVAHSLVYVQTVEALQGFEIPPRAAYLRTVVHELNRIHSHLLLLGVVGELFGFDTLFMYLWRDRELVMDVVESITGNRLISAFNVLGGVARDVGPSQISEAKRAMEYLRRRMKFYKKVFAEDPTVEKRSKGVGILKPSSALSLCAVGPVIRGSGIKTDVRADDPYAAYGEIPFNVITYDTNDSWARFMVRVDEVFESIGIIEYALDRLPDGPIRARFPRRVREGEAFGRVEAPRGELVDHIISKGGDKPYRFKCRTPTLANILAACEMMRGGQIADVPVSLSSIDPCFACEDRLAIIDVSKGERYSARIRDLMAKYGASR